MGRILGAFALHTLYVYALYLPLTLQFMPVSRCRTNLLQTGVTG